MTVAFTACTNEEILEVNAPSNMDEAVALGEGYAIVGSKGVESRFVINENDGKFTTTWEKTDMVGGAWIGYQTKAEEEGTYPAGYLFVARTAGLTDGVTGTVGQEATRMTVGKLLQLS